MRKHQILVFSLISLVLAAVLFFLYNHNPAEPGVYPPCPFLYLTGLYCPGCGSLRAVHNLLHGNFLTALAFNPLLVLSLPFLLFLAKREVSRYFLSQKTGTGSAVVFFKTPYRTILVIIMLFWVLRNIPVKPLNFLAPGGFFS